MPEARKVLFCGHLADDDGSEDDAFPEGHGNYLPAEHDEEDFLAQLTPADPISSEDQGTVYVTDNDDDPGRWIAYWQRGDEQHDLADGTRDEVLRAARAHMGSAYLITHNSDPDGYEPIDWAAVDLPAPRSET